VYSVKNEPVKKSRKIFSIIFYVQVSGLAESYAGGGDGDRPWFRAVKLAVANGRQPLAPMLRSWRFQGQASRDSWKEKWATKKARKHWFASFTFGIGSENINSF